MPEFQPSSTHTATLPITVAPADLACEVEIWLSLDGETKAASSGLVSFTSIGSEQQLSLPVTMPSEEGTYQVLIDVYCRGNLIAAYQALEDVSIVSPIPSTYYMPWGGVRMPVCTEWANGECVAWNPVDATVSTYVVREGWWPGQFVAMAVDYTCKEYWDTKDELASVIAKGLGHNPVPLLDEWVLKYGTVCPVCHGTGQVVCTREMHACQPGKMTECRYCHGLGKVLLVDLERGWRDWQKEIAFHEVCGAGSCTPSIRCPYCDQKIYGPSHTRGLSWDKESFVRTVLQHIEEKHPNHPLTEPAWF